MRKKKEKKESKSYRLKEFQCREPTARHIFPWSNFLLVVSVRGVSWFLSELVGTSIFVREEKCWWWWCTHSLIITWSELVGWNLNWDSRSHQQRPKMDHCEMVICFYIKVLKFWMFLLPSLEFPPVKISFIHKQQLNQNLRPNPK